MENLQEKIAKRAYELFLARGGQDGYHIQDWLQAEKELKKPATSEKVSAPKTVVSEKATVADSALKVKPSEPAIKPKTDKVPPVKKIEKVAVKK